ncbi:MAG: hypothetical protein JSU85_05800 [Candidatus Zixiibacteriota bacterium]|nr:MAG: hypothetical protein JSU85_05800 [candidate division Zixibacteria bacterium]
MNQDQSIIFGVFAETEEQLQYVLFLAESMRVFAGRYKDAPLWVYIPPGILNKYAQLENKITALGAEIKTSRAPEKSLRFYFARKVFAAGKAESEAEGNADILVWMDNDTVILSEPTDFELKGGISFAYRPVMHNRSGSLYSEPPGAFWSRIYEKLNIDETALFPMVTPADRQTIRAYFNAGLLVVRPEQRILRRWGEDFTTLYSDSILANMCENDIEKKIFIHQTALVGAVLNNLKKEQMTELSDRYNYPIFFHQQYEAEKEFSSIEDIITLRYDVYFRNPDPEWSKKLQGPSDIVEWLKERLGK